jgi:catechol 2,3-dioxygenase-like lactoylglutathione lyase family enzyme
MKPAARVHHTGFTVSDLERTRDWYQRLFGLVRGDEMTASGDVISEFTQVDGAEVRAAFITCGDTAIELLQYTPPGRPFDRRNDDVGNAHVCLVVDDIDEAFAVLSEEGFPPTTSEPLRVTEGDLAGYAVIYFRDPDGILVELYELPPGA